MKFATTLILSAACFTVSLAGCGSDIEEGPNYGSLKITDGVASEFAPCKSERTSEGKNFFTSFTCERGSGQTEKLVIGFNIPYRYVRYTFTGASDNARNFEYSASCDSVATGSPLSCSDSGEFPLDKSLTYPAENAFRFDGVRLKSDKSASDKDVVLNGTLFRSP
jgi:hypothetical protein